VETICHFFERSRQAFYKRHNQSVKTFIEEQLILSEVHQIRRKQPRVGTRKLWLDLREIGFKISNLIKGIILTGPDQVFVSDITYLRTMNGFVYLRLITDAWSRKIVGWDVSSSLSVEGALNTLKMALKNMPNPEGLLHHSYRGIQYCCNEYVSTSTSDKSAPITNFFVKCIKVNK